jgi:hypothetical protein
MDQYKNQLPRKPKLDEEKKKLKNEVESWKREYCDLLDKSMSTNVSTSRILSSEEKFRPKSSRPNIKQSKNSAKNIKSSSNDYEKTVQDLSNFKNESLILKRKNSLDDSLNNSSSDKNEMNDDDEIDELLRKSVTNLSNLKSEIK